eukprot:79575_1
MSLLIITNFILLTSGSYLPNELLTDSVHFLPFKEQQKCRHISNRFNRIFNEIHNSIIDIKLLQKLITKINDKEFNESITEIERIHNKCKLNELYLSKLPKIIQISSQIVNKPNNTANYNFNHLMNILNIKPITVYEVQSDKFQQEDFFTKLLILSSRAIIHSFGFPIPLYIHPHQSAVHVTPVLIAHIPPWFIPGYKIELVLDSFKTIYESLADYLNLNQNEHLNYLMNEHNLIPWNFKIIKSVSPWEFSEFIQCYYTVMNVLHNILHSTKIDVLCDATFLLKVLQNYKNDLSICADKAETNQAIQFINYNVFHLYRREMFSLLECIVVRLHQLNGTRFVNELLYFTMGSDNGYYSTLFDILIQIGAEKVYEENLLIDDYIRSKFELYHFGDTNGTEVMKDINLKYLLSTNLPLDADELLMHYLTEVSDAEFLIWKYVIEDYSFTDPMNEMIGN